MPHPIDPKTGKQRRGFAGMNPERRTEIARLGGAAIPAAKRSYSRSHKLAVEAGRKGGLVTKADRLAKQEA